MPKQNLTKVRALALARTAGFFMEPLPAECIETLGYIRAQRAHHHGALVELKYRGRIQVISPSGITSRLNQVAKRAATGREVV